MEIRRAEEADMPRIEELLRQVNLVHHKGRPDLFKYGARKYTDEELRVLIHDDSRPTSAWTRPAAASTSARRSTATSWTLRARAAATT